MKTTGSGLRKLCVVLLTTCAAACAQNFPNSKEDSNLAFALMFVHLNNQYYSKFLMVVGAGDSTVRSFSIDESTGALTQVSSLGAAVSGIGLDIHPTLPYIYQARNEWTAWRPSDSTRQRAY